MLKQTRSFCDGITNIYKVSNLALPGDMPKEGLVLQQALRYHERTVGITRKYAALQSNKEVNFVIRCPEVRTVETDYIAVLVDEKQYRISWIQYPEDIDPPVMDMTLERLSDFYDIS